MSNLEVRVSFHLQSRAAGGGEVDLSGTQRVVAVPLGDDDTPGGIVAWPNPAGAAIVLLAVRLRQTAAVADPLAASVGVGATATSAPGDADYAEIAGTTFVAADGLPAAIVEIMSPRIIPAGGYLLIARGAADYAGAGPPLANAPVGTYSFGTSYHDTSADTYYRMTGIGDPVDGNVDYTWTPVTYSAAGLGGFAYLYWHPAA
jgi:hypothetical protein